MKHLTTTTLTLATLLLAACGPNHDKEQRRINEMEDTLRQAEYVADPATSRRMMNTYLRFVDHFPQDTMAAIYLYRASDLAFNIGCFDTTISCLYRIVDDYPEFEEASTCYYLIGNAYEEYGKLDSAVMAYKEYLRFYPDQPFAESAQSAIDNIGKSPEELLRSILSKRDTI